jgi:hypothetical protein
MPLLLISQGVDIGFSIFSKLKFWQLSSFCRGLWRQNQNVDFGFRNCYTTSEFFERDSTEEKSEKKKRFPQTLSEPGALMVVSTATHLNSIYRT